MINYVEKGFGLHAKIRASGHHLKKVDGRWKSSDDAAVQSIIDSYDPVLGARKSAIKRIKIESSNRISQIYSFIDPDSTQGFGLYRFAKDLWGGGDLPPRLLQLKLIYDAAKSAINDINLMTDWVSIESYDAITTPKWP